MVALDVHPSRWLAAGRGMAGEGTRATKSGSGMIPVQDSSPGTGVARCGQADTWTDGG